MYLKTSHNINVRPLPKGRGLSTTKVVLTLQVLAVGQSQVQVDESPLQLFRLIAAT